MTVNNAHISEQFLQDVLRGEKLADVTLLIFRDPKRFTAGDLHRAVRRSRSAGAPAYFAGAGKLRQKLRQTKL